MSNMWKFVLFGVAGLILAGAAFGIVAAQEGTETPSGTGTPAATPSGEGDAEGAQVDKEGVRDEYLSRLTDNLGVTQDELEAALKQTALDIVDEKVADGSLTEEQAAEIRERIESGEGLLFPGLPGFKHGAGVGFHLGASLDDLAEFLGVDVADIRDALQNGQTLAEVAEANGKTADELAAYLLDRLEERLADAVENGRITQERADEILAGAPDHIDDLINGERPFFRHGRPGRFNGAFEGAIEPPLGAPMEDTTGVIF